MAVAAVLLGLAAGAQAATSYKQPGFSESVVFSGLTNPTVVRFLPDGRVFVAEKSGLIKVFPNLTTQRRHGRRRPAHRGPQLLGPRPARPGARPELRDATTTSTSSTPTTPPIGGTPPRWGAAGATSDGCPTPPGATTDGCVVSGRLSRLTAIGTDWTASETAAHQRLVPAVPEPLDRHARVRRRRLPLRQRRRRRELQQRRLRASSAATPATRPANPCGDPPVGVGARADAARPPRAARCAARARGARRASRAVLNGSILRVDPATGAGVPGNPLVGIAATPTPGASSPTACAIRSA